MGETRGRAEGTESSVGSEAILPRPPPLAEEADEFIGAFTTGLKPRDTLVSLLRSLRKADVRNRFSGLIVLLIEHFDV